MRPASCPCSTRGFALAEFSYPEPGARFHRDVDVLVRPQDFKPALAVGHAKGWHTPRFDHRLVEHTDPHEFWLKRADANVMFDVHQRLVPAHGFGVAREQALTFGAWQRARERTWEDAIIRTFDPIDAFIFGMVLPRCWGATGGHQSRMIFSTLRSSRLTA